MKQISLHICIIHFVTKDLAANAVTSKTDALGCHHWHPALSVFAKQKHSSNSQCTIGADKSQVAKYLLTVMPPCYRRAYRIKRCFIKSVTSQAFLLQHSLKTVAKKQFDSHCIKVVDSCVPNTSFVRSKTAAVCHHFCEFGIVENLTLVCSILHPYNSFIIMIWLVKAFLHRSNNHVAFFNLNCIYPYQNGRHYIFRSDVTQQVCNFLHFRIRQRIDFTSLVLYANNKSATMRVAESHQLASYVIFVENAFFKLHSRHLANLYLFQYIVCHSSIHS